MGELVGVWLNSRVERKSVHISAVCRFGFLAGIFVFVGVGDIRG